MKVFVVSCWRGLVLSVGLGAVAHGAAPDPDLTVTAIAREGQLFVSFDLAEALTADVRDAIQSGLATTFAYDVELRRPSSWFDRTVAAVTISATVRFDNLTRRYSGTRSLRLFRSRQLSAVWAADESR